MGTTGKGTLQAAAALAVMEVLNEHLGTKPLRYARAFMMIALAGEQGLDQELISKSLTPVGASRAKDALREMGFIDKEDYLGDMRRNVLTLTAEGKKVWQRVLARLEGSK